MAQNTVHSLNTVHAITTPHQLPQEETTQLEIFDLLSLQLYPTGRAWYKPEGGIFNNLHQAINISFVRAVNDARAIINETLPDNEDFTARDAALWEFRLGLITNDAVDIELRRQAIIRKLSHPNNVQARQHPNFIESQLRVAGFNVFVHENTIPYRTPFDILGTSPNTLRHSDTTFHSDNTQHGGDSFAIIANSTEEIESFSVNTADLWATFFIGGPNLGDVATVPRNRLKEFKELVIKFKPAHTVVFTFIDYI